MSEQYQLHPDGESFIFDSWDELLTRLHPEPNGILKNRESTERKKDGWAGTETYAEAEKLAREGWMAPVADIERISGHVEERIDTSIIQTSFASRYDVAGGEVDIARYLDGDPECMIESEPIRISRHGRAVRVVIPGAYSSATSKDAILGRGAAVVALADVLAKAQHPLEVWVAYAVTDGGEQVVHQVLVRIQRADEPIDIGRLGFAIAHPASLRRIGFRAIEHTVTKAWLAKNLRYSYGYGSGNVDLSGLPEAENTILVPNLGHEGRGQWEKEEFCIQWVNEQLDRIFD